MPKWVKVLKTFGPLVLLATPAAPIAPFIMAGIESAERLHGASSAEKLAHAKAIASAAVGAVNAQAGTVVVNPALVDRTADDAIALTVDITNRVAAQTDTED